MEGHARTRWLAAVALVAFLAAPAAAVPDWNRVDDPMMGGIGLHAGKIGGSGLAIKYPLAWFLQVQLAGGIWRTTDDRWNNLGLELQYILRQDPRLRLFLVGGVARYHDEDRKEDPELGEYWEKSTDWNAGFGVGVEWLLGERWAVKGDVDFTWQDDDDSITVWPQAGLMFYW
jgi:hypothetical protein